jgi:hypothetical protein
MQPRSSHSSRGVKETDAAAIHTAGHGGTGLADESADGAPVAAKRRAKPRQQGGTGPRVSVPSARRPIDPLPAEGRWEDTAEGPPEDDVLAPLGQAGSDDAETAPAGEPGGPGAATSGTPAPEAPEHRTPSAPESDPWAEVALPEVARRAAPATPRSMPRGPQPGWGTVLVTTVKLWSQRRLAPPASRVRSVVTTWRFVLAVAVAAVIFVAGAITVALSARTPPAGKPQPSQQASAPAGHAGGGLATATVARQQAALWVFQQVSSDAVVSCDPAMCSVLEQYGVPAGRLLTLRPGQSDPLGSDVVVATPALRSEFGSRLTTVYAPVTLAVFGSGSTRIDIRALAPDGAAAYSSALSADERARKQVGEQMATNPRITVSGTARQQLAAGRVDSRLLLTLTTLAAMHPVNIMQFGTSPGAGTTPGVPLRSADISTATTARVLRHFFGIQRPPYHPAALNVLKTGPRGTVLHVLYPAPSPLGLLGTRS